MEPTNEPGALGEFELIERFFAPLAAGAPLAFGLQDDAAVFRPTEGCDLVLTKDALVEGVHFFSDDPPDLIARKLLRVNLSDLAAKGARPCGYLLGAGFVQNVAPEWVEQFAHGLARDNQIYGISLLGGDTVSVPGPAMFTLTAVGEVKTDGMIRRAGAQPGDLLFVSGTIGDGVLGLDVQRGESLGLSPEAADVLRQRYLLPEPRVALGQALVGLATAALDISDGLVADLAHLCAVSGVGAEVDAGLVPLSAAGRAALAQDEGLLERVLTGGDDYELLFAVPPDKVAEIARISAECDVAITQIGCILPADRKMRFLGPAGHPLSFASQGYRHF